MCSSLAALAILSAVQHPWEATDTWKGIVTNSEVHAPQLHPLPSLLENFQQNPILQSNQKATCDSIPSQLTLLPHFLSVSGKPHPNHCRHCGFLNIVLFIHTCMPMASGPRHTLRLLPGKNANSHSVPSYPTSYCTFICAFASWSHSQESYLCEGSTWHLVCSPHF